MQEKRIWYREPWVWLLIVFPLSAVIGGIITIYLAVSTSDGLVVDDYYKHGKTINLALARDAAAAENRLLAELDFNREPGQVYMQLSGDLAALPPVITLSLLHPTRKGHDQVLQMAHAGEGRYQAALVEPGDGRWYLQLGTADWRLSGAMQMPPTQPVVLQPLPASKSISKPTPQQVQ